MARLRRNSPRGRLKEPILRARFIVFMLGVCFLRFSLYAGPPFHTDDPEPVELYHWEFYCASQMTGSQDGISGTAPHFEINYGIFPEMQIHIIVPLSSSHPRTGNSAYGPGDVELGLKHRPCRKWAFFHCLKSQRETRKKAWVPEMPRFLSHYGCKRVGGNGQPMAEADALSP